MVYLTHSHSNRLPINGFGLSTISCHFVVLFTLSFGGNTRCFLFRLGARSLGFSITPWSGWLSLPVRPLLPTHRTEEQIFVESLFFLLMVLLKSQTFAGQASEPT